MPSDSSTAGTGPESKLVGSRGAAEMLGVTDAAIRKLVSRGRFPPADLMLDGRRLWCRTTIERFAAHRRGPGRPRKSLAADPLQQSAG